MHEQMVAASAVLIFYASVVIMHAVLPAVSYDGYACDWKGSVLIYRLNGPLCLVGVFIAWLASPAHVASYASVHFYECLFAANMLGLVGAFVLLKACPHEAAFRCLTVDQKELRERAAREETDLAATWNPTPPRNALQHYFYGVAFNPRVCGIDLKMLLYALGAGGLLWQVLSAVALRQQLHGAETPLSTAMTLYVGMLAWFLGEYMCLEVVHLYTYDLFCEKLGFKLCWGCLTFYPFFYCIGVWPLVHAPPSADVGAPTATLIALLFAAGWVLTRGANLQKFVFKRRGGDGAAWLGLPMTTLPGTRLLVSGFWGLSRHVNYAGEITQAVALALPGTLVAPTAYYACLPWLYPLYYIALFIPRQIDDDEQIRRKYGDATFRAYKARVPWRIVPGVW